MLERRTGRLVALSFVAVVVALAVAPAEAQHGCVPLKGTITGHLRPYAPVPGLPGFENFDWDGEGGWYGRAELQFGDAKAVPMLLIDHGIPGKEKKVAPPSFGGEEILTFKLPGGQGSFRMHGSFMAIAAPAPSLFAFNENGSIIGGDGQYAGARGWMTINGLFAAPEFVMDLFDSAHDPFLWIAQVNGVYCGPR